MILEKEVKDVRGKIAIFSVGDRQVNVVEIKKGYSRGGHYHDFATSHTVVVGKIEYTEKDTKTGKETKTIVPATTKIDTPAFCAHLLTAIEDTVFVEAFQKPYSATNYPEYRNIVEEKMKENQAADI